MKINWIVRFKNKYFWMAIIPAVLLLVQVIAGLFGFTLEMDGISDKLLDVVNAVFVVLALLGIVTDPTTAGMTDSVRAMGYVDPVDSDYMTMDEKIGGSE